MVRINRYKGLIIILYLIKYMKLKRSIKYKKIKNVELGIDK